MINTFSINYKYQYKSIKGGLYQLIGIPLGLLILHLTGKITFVDYPNLIIGIGIFYILLFLPVLYLQIM